MGEPATEIEEGFEGWESQRGLPTKIGAAMWVPELKWIGVSMGVAPYSFRGAGLFQFPDEWDDSVCAIESLE